MTGEILEATALIDKDKILDFLFKNAVSRAIPMNDFLEPDFSNNLKGVVGVFREFEKKKFVQCDGNYGWLGSWHNGEQLDLTHPLTRFTCQLLPAGVDYVKQRIETNLSISVDQASKGSSYSDESSIPWYQHWIFWLVCIAVLMAVMIGLVEYNGV
jgi:hypothetical protein